MRLRFFARTGTGLTLWVALAPWAVALAHRAGPPTVWGDVTVQDPRGAQTLQRVCSACHTPERILAARKSRAQWDEVMDKMVSRGAVITDTDYEILMPYLVKSYGRVNVNFDPAEELVEVLGLSTESAEAVVSYRKSHGKFADFEALVKVPGLDIKRLEPLRDAIDF